MRLKDEAEGRFISDLELDLGLDFWNDLRVNAPSDIMVSPENLHRLLIALGIIHMRTKWGPKSLLGSFQM